MEQSGPTPPPVTANTTRMTQPRARWIGILGSLLLLLAGIAAGGWAMQTWLQWRERPALPGQLATASGSAGAPASNGAAQAQALVEPAPTTASVPGDIAARVAMLESRVTAMTAASDSMTGNAMRAEGVLLALAARRALDRGISLGPLENQLRLRFGGAQPNAVNTLIEAARRPVTLDRLQTGLDQLAPQLIGRAPEASLWSDVRREAGDLFTVRRAQTPSPRAAARVDRARRLLEIGSVDRASREIAALPAASLAANWLAEAEQYHDARRALDLIETAAILAPPDAANVLTPPAAPPRR